MPAPRLLDAELPEIGERWRRLLPLALAPFGVGFGLGVTVSAVFHEAIMVGPGFVDEGVSGIALARETMANIAATSGGRAFLWLFAPLLAFAVVQNAVVCYRSVSLYPRVMGRPYPLRALATFFGLNAALVGLLYLMLAACALVWWAAGGPASAGWEVIRHITITCGAWLEKIPTLVELPYPLPLVAVVLGVDLAAYWLHRLSHSRRALWLLLHRPHHMTPHLAMPVTLPVYAAAPLFLLFAVPFQLLMGASTKLFAAEPMIVEALLLRVVCHTLGIYSHCEVYYAWTRECRPVRWLSSFYGVGSYHYMHHSARPGHEAINLGNWFFMFWDRVFGTYVTPTEERPPTGLTGQPPLHSNPLRLALAGVMQLGYELRHNRGLAARWKIVTGGTDYTPPKSRDFALAEPG